MSADQAAFGSDGSNSRSSTLSATGSPCRESVVRTNRRGALARMPCSRISLATVFSGQACPRAFSSAVIRGLPYRPFTSAWMTLIAAASSPRRSSPADGARAAQAWYPDSDTSRASQAHATGQSPRPSAMNRNVRSAGWRSTRRLLLAGPARP